MTILDTTVLGEVQLALLEPNDGGATVPSGLWTPAELLDAINSTQMQFLKDTLLLVSHAELNTIPNVLRHALPEDWICTYDASYRNADNAWNELAKSDGFEADNSSLSDWPIEHGAPVLYTDGELPTLSMQIMPSSLDAGVIHLLYTALSAELTGLGVAFTVPDEFVAPLKWSALAQLLGKVGRGADGERAAYCMQRYEEGVVAAALILGGWS